MAKPPFARFWNRTSFHQRLFSILLRDPFGPDDFEAFITERQRTIQDAIENLLIKERLDLEPQLRDLDKAA